MMKLRDDADRKALEALGLVEPEEESKALELGFPKRHRGPMSSSLSTSSADDEGIPMPLASFLEGIAQNPEGELIFIITCKIEGLKLRQTTTNFFASIALDLLKYLWMLPPRS